MSSNFTPEKVVVTRHSDGSKTISKVYSFETWSNISFFKLLGLIAMTGIFVPWAPAIFFTFYCLRSNVNSLPNSHNLLGAITSIYVLIDFHYQWIAEFFIRISVEHTNAYYSFVCLIISLLVVHCILFFYGSVFRELGQYKTLQTAIAILIFLILVYVCIKFLFSYDTINRYIILDVTGQKPCPSKDRFYTDFEYFKYYLFILGGFFLLVYYNRMEYIVPENTPNSSNESTQTLSRHDSRKYSGDINYLKPYDFETKNKNSCRIKKDRATNSFFFELSTNLNSAQIDDLKAYLRKALPQSVTNKSIESIVKSKNLNTTNEQYMKTIVIWLEGQGYKVLNKWF